MSARKTWPILAFIVVLGSVIAVTQLKAPTPVSIAFDRNSWLSEAKAEHPKMRPQMVKDLVANHLRVGMTRANVIKLLGKEESYGDGKSADAKSSLIYLVEREEGDPEKQSVWVELLEITLDSHDKVIRVETVDV